MESDTAEDSHLGSGKPKKNDESMDANTDARSSDEVSNCLSLQSKHTIFLSHSGAQKDFVESLCEDLEDRNRFPFFDKRSSSLPKGEKFPKLILEAAKQCKMAVVVVSEEYFTSKWPMLELNTFVQATRGPKPQLKILPLFFGMSVSEFGNSSRQEGWFHEWEKWAKDDARIKPLEYKNALKVMQSFNGIEFNQEMRDVSMYQRDVVATVCTIISPDVKWDDSHVQGRSNLCEAVREKIKKIELFGKNGICIFGFHGVGGIGKTTMCKTLCNELSEFSSKVCHIDLGANRSLEELLKDVLKKLMGKSEEFLHRLNMGECRNILRKGILWEQKTFLAIDNVWDDTESLGQAGIFLNEAAYHEGSVVMVTARSQKTLTYLGIDETQCFEVPELGEADARNLFLYHAAKGKQFVNEADSHVIKECIARCCFRKGEKQGFHYLPLALKALGMQLGCLGNNPSDWGKSLPMVRDFNHFQQKINPVFSIIRVNFDRLPAQEQAFFMDIALYNPRSTEDEGLIGWLSLVHRQTLEDTQSQVQRLIGKGLLEDVDLISQKVSMHDLYLEFARMESQGKLNPAGLDSRRWVYWRNTYPSDLEMTPSGRCWENLIRVGIEQENGYKAIAILSLEGIQWRYCSNVVVLKLVGLRKLKAVLNLKSLRCLRSLQLRFLDELDGVEGLEDLHSLTYFQWLGVYYNFTVDDSVRRTDLGQSPVLNYNGWPSRSETSAPRSYLGQLPASLKVLQVHGVGVSLRRDVFARCTNLCKLMLFLIRAGDGLDFSQCTSLQSVVLKTIQGLQKLSGLAAGLTSCIQSLRIHECDDLIDLSELEHLVGLQHLELHGLGTSELKKLPDLKKLTSLQTLSIQGCVGIVEVRGLGSLRQLRELSCSYMEITELPNLSELEQLHHLGLEGCRKLITLHGMGDLPALRDLDLYGCGILWLPDLSKSTNLEELNLVGTGIELLEKDIQMLAKLPKLRPVVVDNYPDDIRLDMVRRKVLKYNSQRGTVLEERDLGTTPIRVGDYGGCVNFIYFA